MSQQSLLDLTLRITSDIAELKKGIADTNNQLGGFKSGLQSVGKFLVGAFSVTAIIATSKAVFEFSQKIGEATNKVKNLTGVINKDLASSTAKILAISQTFDKDFNQVLESANNASKSLGVSLPETLSLLELGLANAGTRGDEFLDIVKEYPSALQGAGISAEQFIAIASQSVKDGTFSDKGIDSIKEFSIRITRELTPAAQNALAAIGLSGTEIQNQIENGTITTFDAMQQVSGALNSVGLNSNTAKEAVSQLFGSAGEDAGINFIGNLATIDTSIEGITANLTEGAKAQLRLSKATAEWNEVFTSTLGNSSTLFTDLKADAIEVATKGIKAIINGVIDAANFFIELYNESVLFRIQVQQVVFWFKALIDVIKLVGKNIFDVFGSAGELIKAVFTGNFQDIPRIYKEAIGKVVENTKEFAVEIATDFKDGVEAVINNKPIKLISQDTIDQAKSDLASITAQPIISTGGAGGSGAAGGSPVTSVGSLGGGAFSIPMPDVTGILDARIAQDEWNASIAQSALESEQLAAQQQYLAGIIKQSAAQQKVSGNVFEQVNKMLINSATGVIKSYIAEGIAGAVSKTLASLPYPANVILAGVAGAAASSLLNSIIPTFADGGLHSGGWALVGERGPELINTSSPARVYTANDTARMFNSAGSMNQRIEVIGVIGNDAIYLANKEAQRRRGEI